ncbi:unnamed protein product [Tuber melanosporum]|uniref:(Perigord truffle) hypothetical protein n=1 Tax=Tuber melanosporum (strain Mel28) TaxID=656061 RepID=D5G9F2_TUBMM|nr:uncharacterized protein GSTUM_00003278001 [Tuber melanosporum]CAZ81145.1 unnamed protein product [Tuber melanosporum]
MSELTEFDKQRAANIARNQAILASLGLEVNAAPKPPNKRVKVKREGPIEGVRKSARVASAPKRKYRESNDRSEKENDSDDGFTDESESDADFYSDDSQPPSQLGKRRRGGYAPGHDGPVLPGDGEGLRRRVVNGRNVQHIDPEKRAVRPDPKVFGPIRGIKVGHWWPSRLACSADAVHPPTVGGIYGGTTTGAYSVAVSGGYEDDVDEGFRFTFTGSGGRDLKGTASNPKNLRTAPQSSDQTLTGFNLALKVSCDTGNPVRVIRGFKATLGPEEGYRYDGLYKVLKAWQETGLSGFKVWKYAFKRIDGQAPLDTSIGKPDDFGDEDDYNIKDETEENPGQEPPEPGTGKAEWLEEEAEDRPKRTRRSTRKSYREIGGEATSTSTPSGPTTPASKLSDNAETSVTSDDSYTKMEPVVLISRKTGARASSKNKYQPLVSEYFSPKGDDSGVTSVSRRSSRRVSKKGEM